MEVILHPVKSLIWCIFSTEHCRLGESAFLVFGNFYSRGSQWWRWGSSFAPPNPGDMWTMGNVWKNFRLLQCGGLGTGGECC